MPITSDAVERFWISVGTETLRSRITDPSWGTDILMARNQVDEGEVKFPVRT